MGSPFTKLWLCLHLFAREVYIATVCKKLSTSNSVSKSLDTPAVEVSNYRSPRDQGSSVKLITWCWLETKFSLKTSTETPKIILLNLADTSHRTMHIFCANFYTPKISGAFIWQDGIVDLFGIQLKMVIRMLLWALLSIKSTILQALAEKKIAYAVALRNSSEIV